VAKWGSVHRMTTTGRPGTYVLDVLDAPRHTGLLVVDDEGGSLTTEPYPGEVLFLSVERGGVFLDANARRHLAEHLLFDLPPKETP
jgi:hypothetical protein